MEGIGPVPVIADRCLLIINKTIITKSMYMYNTVDSIKKRQLL